MRRYYGLFRESVLLLSRVFGPSGVTDPSIPSNFSITADDPNVTLLFLPSIHPRTRFHIVLLMRLRQHYWFIDPGDKLSILPSAKMTHERLISMLKPAYIVNGEIKFSSKIEERIPMLPEPYSCVTVARSILGIDDPLIHTPEQLLNYLWERRA